MVVDAVRGAAVLSMMEWHCADAWIGGPLRDGEGFALTRIVGGFAAPLFLLLAGVSAALVFAPGRAPAGARRGLSILVGGYAFKLFAWAVDYGALVELRNWPAIALDALTLWLASRAVGDRPLRDRATECARAVMTTRERLVLAGASLASALLTWVALNGTTRTPSVILRLDVLQGIGAALVVVNGVLALVHGRRHAASILAVSAALVALATPSFVGLDLSFLPTRVADYVARTTVDTAASGARFPLFPWLGYTLLGAAIGTAVRGKPPGDPWAVPFFRHAALALVIAVAVGACTFEPSRVARFVLGHFEQGRNAMRLAWNTSVATVFAALASLTLPRVPAAERALLSLGRHSLVVYVVHLELAYGLPAIPIREALGFGGWAVGVAVLVAMMVALSFWLDRRDAQARAARA